MSLTHQPCPCGKSSDAYSENEQGGKCFSCGKFYPKEKEKMDEKFTYQYIPWRGISADSFKKFGCPTKVNDGGEPIAIAFPYGEFGRKIRLVKEKKFYSEGSMKDASLFGMDVFAPGSSDSIIVTEGELDALSAFQICGTPSVSIRGASSAFVDCSRNLDYLLSFRRVYLCFDNDGPGQEATHRVSQLIGERAYHVKLTGKQKDANDFLQQGLTEEFKNVVFYSRRFIPNEIVSSYNEVSKILHESKKRPIISYPFKQLQGMTYGICQGITLITAQEGIGKTEIIRAIEAHILRETDFNIGIIHLEESRRRSIQGLAGYELQQPLHLPDSFCTADDALAAYQRITKRDERVYHINHFDDDDPKIALELIRFLVAKCGCKIVFLDHITQLVTALEGDDERKKLDFFSTKLEQMTQELEFSCIVVSHVNDEGKTRGSRYISKVANVRIDLQRDHLNANPVERNKTYLTVSKNRDGAKTGPSSILYFNPDTFVIKEWDECDEFVQCAD